MDTTNTTITGKTTADLSGTISFLGSIINTTPNPYIGTASTMANSASTTITNLKNKLEQRIAALESKTSYLLSKVSELENKVDNLTSRISELENPNRCKLDPEIGAVICDL
jgi:peptidoglycan hydrolase CwlO-like protein